MEQFTDAQPIYDVHEDPELMKGTPLEVVCKGRVPCRELMSEDAGKTSQGALRVVSVSLAPEGFERQFEPGSCEPIEHWAVTTNASGQVVRFQLLLELCNDGYGASGIGDDTIEVTPNHLAHAQVGGSNHRWNHAVTYQLYPRRIAAWSEGGMIASTGSHFDYSWDFREFRGRAEALELTCGPDGDAIEGWTEADVTKWELVPVVETDESFVRGGWRKARIGQCGARLAHEGAGFVVHGTRDSVADQNVTIVGLRDGSFLIEVVDDRFVLKADKVIHEDHLELWTSEGEGLSGADFCVPERKEKPVQWGIRLADGAVFQGFGKPNVDALQTEVVHGDGYMLVWIKPKKETQLIAFVYSDSDDGQKQKSLVATSSLRPGKSTSLGERFFIHPSAATCEVRAGKLQPAFK